MTDENKCPADQGGAQISDFNTSDTNSTISQPQETKSAGGDPELATILSAMTSAFTRHLSLPKGAPDAIALWILGAHNLSVAEFSPRLAFVSPLPACGKTTALRLLKALVPNPLACSNISQAAIYRTLANDAGRTLILDEADTYVDEQSQLKGILNSGHQRATALVVRCDKGKNGGFDPKEFPTFCPMIYARIGEAHPALLTRSIVIRMQRAKSNEAIARIETKDIDALEQLQKRISGHSAVWTARLKIAKPAMPRFLENRSADNWCHMFAIAELAGDDWPSRATEAARLLSPRAELEKGEEVLIMMKRVFDRGPYDKLSSVDICQQLNEIDEGDGEWKPAQLARELKPFGIYPKSIRIGNKTPKGYERSQFQDAWSRYLKPERSDDDGPALASPAATPQQAVQFN